MGTFVANVAKGRVGEYVNRVINNDPANSALIVVPVDRGAATDAALKDLDTLAAVLAAVTERTTGGWARKTITTTAAWTVNDTDDRGEGDFDAQTWATVTAGAITDLWVCYDPDTTAGTDANIIPLTCHEFAITPDGSDVTATVADFFRAS